MSEKPNKHQTNKLTLSTKLKPVKLTCKEKQPLHNKHKHVQEISVIKIFFFLTSSHAYVSNKNTITKNIGRKIVCFLVVSFVSKMPSKQMIEDTFLILCWHQQKVFLFYLLSKMNGLTRRFLTKISLSSRTIEWWLRLSLKTERNVLLQ